MLPVLGLSISYLKYFTGVATNVKPVKFNSILKLNMNIILLFVFVKGICYVTHPSYIPEACREWEKRTNNAIVDYVVVPQLPRGALLEWHIWAHRHNNMFECKY